MIGNNIYKLPSCNPGWFIFSPNNNTAVTYDSTTNKYTYSDWIQVVFIPGLTYTEKRPYVNAATGITKTLSPVYVKRPHCSNDYMSDMAWDGTTNISTAQYQLKPTTMTINSTMITAAAAQTHGSDKLYKGIVPSNPTSSAVIAHVPTETTAYVYAPSSKTGTINGNWLDNMAGYIEYFTPVVVMDEAIPKNMTVDSAEYNKFKRLCTNFALGHHVPVFNPSITFTNAAITLESNLNNRCKNAVRDYLAFAVDEDVLDACAQQYMLNYAAMNDSDDEYEGKRASVERVGINVRGRTDIAIFNSGAKVSIKHSVEEVNGMKPDDYDNMLAMIPSIGAMAPFYDVTTLDTHWYTGTSQLASKYQNSNSEAAWACMPRLWADTDKKHIYQWEVRVCVYNNTTLSATYDEEFLNFLTTAHTDRAADATLIGGLTQQMNSTQKLAEVLSGAYDTIDSAVAEAQAEAAAIQAQIEEKEIDLAALEEDITTATGQLEDISSQLDSMNVEYETLLADIDDAQVEYNGYMTQIAQVNLNLSSLTSQYNNLLLGVQDLTTQKNNLQTDYNNLQSDMVLKQAEYGDLEDDIETANATLTSLNTQLGNVQSNLTTAQSNLATINTQLTTKQEALTALQADITAAQEELATAQLMVDNFKDSDEYQAIAEAAETLAGIQANITTAQSNLATIQGQITTATASKTTIEGQIATLTSQKETITTEIGTLNSQIAALNTSIASKQTEEANVIAAIAASQAELADMEEAVANYADSPEYKAVLDLSQTVTELEEQIAELEAELTELNDSILTATAQKNTIAAQIGTMTVQSTQLANQITALQEEIATLLFQKESATSDVATKYALLAQLQTQEDNARAVINQLASKQNELNQVNADLAAAQAARDSIDAENYNRARTCSAKRYCPWASATVLNGYIETIDYGD